MKFAIDCQIEVGDTLLSSTTVLENLDQYRDGIGEISFLEGKLVLLFDGEEGGTSDYSDPVIRLADGWVRKIPWVITGDTETVVLRNSEHCFAFMPAGNAVEISFFEGDAAEIEEYVMEPTNVLLSSFVQESIRFAEHILALVRAIDAGLLESNDDCRDLAASLGEAKRAWKDYQVRQRR